MPRTRAGKDAQEGIAVYAPYLANFRLASPRLACLTDCRLTDQQPWLYGSRVKHISHKTRLSLTRLAEHGSKIRASRPCFPYSPSIGTSGTYVPCPCPESPQVMYISAPLALVSMHTCVYTNAVGMSVNSTSVLHSKREMIHLSNSAAKQRSCLASVLQVISQLLGIGNTKEIKKIEERSFTCRRCHRGAQSA